MCGIVGLVGKDINYKTKEIFTDLLRFDTIRGVHSTGVMSVPLDNKDIKTFKKAVDGHTFTDLKRYDKFLTTSILPRLLLGHNRAASAGRVSDLNAHPFNDGSTHLVHNGTLKAWANLHNSRYTDVDSEAVCFEIEHSGIIKTVSKLNGSFTLAHYDEKEHNFNMIRNRERPMWLAQIKGLDLTVFASEPGIIMAACLRNGYEIKDFPFSLDIGTMATFGLTDDKDVGKFYVTKDVEFYKPPPSTYQSYTSKKPHTPSTHSMTTTRAGGTEVGPSSLKEKRHKKVAVRLGKVGLVIGQQVVGQAVSFEYFPHQECRGVEGTGRVIFDLCDPNNPRSNVRMAYFSGTKKIFDQIDSHMCSVTVTSCTQVQYDNSVLLDTPMVTFDGVLTSDEEVDFWELWTWEDEEVESEPNAETLYLVDSQYTTEARYKLKTKDGCCVCSDLITLEDHEDVFWTNGEPLCTECSRDVAFESNATGKIVQDILDELRSK